MTYNQSHNQPRPCSLPEPRKRALSPDRTFYSVVCSLKGEAYARETDLCDMDFGRIVRDIADGQIEEVLAVFAFNPAEGWANDVTVDVLDAAFPEKNDDGNDQPDGWDDPADYTSERIGACEAGCGRWMA